MEKKTRLTLLAAAYVLALVVSYIYFIHPNYSYIGCVYHPSSLSLRALSWVLALVPILWLPDTIRRPSQFAYWLLFLVLYVPATVMPYLTLTTAPEFILLFSLSSLFSFFILWLFCDRIPLMKLSAVELSPRMFWLGFIVVLGLSYVTIASYCGASIMPIKWSEQYVVRAQYDKLIASSGTPIAAYMNSWLSNVLLAFLLAYGVSYRSLLSLGIGLLGGVYIFSFTGYKSAIFLFPFIVCLSLAYRRSGKGFGTRVLLGALALVLLGMSLQALMRSTALNVYIVHRLFMIPGILSGFYLDFFSAHEKLHYSYSIFKSLVPYPYDLPFPSLIGKYYLNGPQNSANVNWLADAFANFGYLGMPVVTAVLGGFFWLYDSASRAIDRRMACLLLCPHIIYLSNSGLSVSLLSGGLAFTFLMVLFCSRVCSA